MMSRSRFTLRREVSTKEDEMINDLVNTIQSWKGCGREDICNTILLSTVATLITVDPENAVTRMIEATESVSEMLGNPIAIFYEQVQHRACTS